MPTTSQFVIEALSARGRRLAFAVSALAFVAAGFGASPANAATAGISCHRLEQNCLAHQARSRQAKTDGASDSDSALAKMDSVCFDQAAAAQTTGIWPAYKDWPAVACSN